MLKSYLSILKRHPSVIAFGALCAFFSNFGQTFFIGLNSAYFQDALSLTSTQFGAVYGGVTLASAGALLLLGHYIDKVPLRSYVLVVCVALAIGCVLMAQAPYLWLFVFGLWLVRFNGQGIMSHMSSTVTAREVHHGRGRALSLAVLGIPAGAMLFPLLFTTVMGITDWRGAWTFYGAVYLLLALPLLWWLAPRGEVEVPDETQTTPAEERKLHHVLRDPALWLLMAANMVMPFILTGVFFHQQWLIQAKGFSLELYAFSFTAYGIGLVIAELLAGDMVDRVGATRVLRFFLLPFIVATIGLIWLPYAFMLPVFMLAAALSAGCTHSARGSYLAERYGVRKLGAIKSLFSSCMVFSTALSPTLFGVIIDNTQNADIIFHLSWMGAAVLCVAMQWLARIPSPDAPH